MPMHTTASYRPLVTGTLLTLIIGNGLLPMLLGIEGREFSHTAPYLLLTSALFAGSLVAQARGDSFHYGAFSLASFIIAFGF
jgi:hypothetical protein